MKKNSLFLLLGMIFMGGAVCYAAPLPAGSYLTSCVGCTYDGTLLICNCAGSGYPFLTTLQVPSGYKGKIESINGKLKLTN